MKSCMNLINQTIERFRATSLEDEDEAEMSFETTPTTPETTVCLQNRSSIPNNSRNPRIHGNSENTSNVTSEDQTTPTEVFSVLAYYVT